MAQLSLRPYQRECISAVKADWHSGLTDIVVVLATGAGKTIVFLELLRQMLVDEDELTGEEFWSGDGDRGLILAHRQELISQPLERIAKFWPDWLPHVGIVMADQDQCDRQLTIGSVQTLVNPARLARILAHGPIDYVVIDECHHANARTYIEIIDQLKRANPRLKHLGVTATPMRSDGDGLKRVYQKVSYKAGIKELIKLGHLVPFKALAVQTEVSLQGVRSADGDYVQSQLADVWECENVWDLIVESHRRWADDRPAMVFTVSVEGAHRLAERFTEAGIPTEAADGTTSREDRKAIVSRFKSGETRILCNCALWTEGLDLPKIACVHMARPTKSDLVYVQAMGRGLRTYPGKEDCLVLDYAPLDARNIVMAGDLLGKPRQQKKIEEQAEKAGVVIAGFSFTGDGTGIDGDPDELVTRPLNYLSMSPYAWYFHDGLSTLGLGDRDDVSRTLVILPPGFGKPYRLVMVERPKGSWLSQVRLIGRGEFDELADQGADLAEELGAPVLVGRDRSWQRMPLTDKQLAQLRRLLPNANGSLPKLSRGEAAKLLTHCYARQAIERAGWRPDPAAKAA
jgi:superfamily II DNA or RNA helicase